MWDLSTWDPHFYTSMNLPFTHISHSVWLLPRWIYILNPFMYVFDISVIHFLEKLNNNFFDIQRDLSGHLSPLLNSICMGRNYEKKILKEIKRFLFLQLKRSVSSLNLGDSLNLFAACVTIKNHSVIWLVLYRKTKWLNLSAWRALEILPSHIPRHVWKFCYVTSASYEIWCWRIWTRYPCNHGKNLDTDTSKDG